MRWKRVLDVPVSNSDGSGNGVVAVPAASAARVLLPKTQEAIVEIVGVSCFNDVVFPRFTTRREGKRVECRTRTEVELMST